MTAIKKLLHADLDAQTFSYEIEETAEHLTVARLSRGPSGGWRYEVTARRIEHEGGAVSEGGEVHGEGGECATPDEAIAEARAQAQAMLAARSR